jgi:hypothetical protein
MSGSNSKIDECELPITLIVKIFATLVVIVDHPA